MSGSLSQSRRSRLIDCLAPRRFGAIAEPTKQTGSADKPESPVETIVIDLGNKKRKQIKQLRRGEGKLMDSLQETLQQLPQDGTIPKGVPPVIVVVGKKMPKMPKNPFC